MNHSYETATYEMKDIKLIGKAKRIIVTIQVPH